MEFEQWATVKAGGGSGVRGWRSVLELSALEWRCFRSMASISGRFLISTQHGQASAHS